jgi:hypothetical protein
LTNLDVRRGQTIKFDYVLVVSQVLRKQKNVETKEFALAGGKVLSRPLEDERQC